MVRAVRIIISPTCSNRDLAGKKALLTADPTICSSDTRAAVHARRAPPGGQESRGWGTLLGKFSVEIRLTLPAASKRLRKRPNPVVCSGRFAGDRTTFPAHPPPGHRDRVSRAGGGGADCCLRRIVLGRK